MNISSFDLNLLVAFDALLTERSVTRAASRLGLSQPAMSNALSRLRDGVGDQLFERTRHGIHPTSRALAMAEPVRSAMTSLQHALLEPAESAPIARSLLVAANMYAQSIVLPRVADVISKSLKPMVLAVREPVPNSPDAALTIDWADAWQRTAANRTALVLRDSLVCIVRRANRSVGTRYTLSGLLEADHVGVGPDRARDAVDSALSLVEKRRRITVQASDFIGAAAIVSETDLVAIIPRRLAELLAQSLGLRILKSPLVLKGQVLQVSWTRRSSADALTMWLKGRVLEAGRKVGRARKS